MHLNAINLQGPDISVLCMERGNAPAGDIGFYRRGKILDTHDRCIRVLNMQDVLQQGS
jgi:hypothetical protein